MSISDQLKQSALEYHRQHPPGKIKVTPTKALTTQRDLSLAYSPGVAAACEVIVDDPREASTVTARGNLVAVITNGTAVLGLGAIGPLAAKPVMEGKGVLFQKFAGIDVFDIEIDERDPDKLVDIIASLEPTFGGINLEDIKAPDCFYIERKLRERMKIPVFHDDQHGTAIVVGAAIINGLKVAGKDIKSVKLLGPTFGGINLEDIKAPECFVIEQRLRELMDIPVFHDDQHGTAIIAAAGLINALDLTGRSIATARMVVNGAGSAGIACAELIKAMEIGRAHV